MADRVPITYTFGNHMHWVDMQWLWGYHVLPGSVRDMLHFCRETGAKDNVNFDGVGYEKLSCEDPEAFAELRAAVQDGTIEVVGASYGQPYGLFHGGESNVRQRVYGARTVRRLFGKWPKTLWEEEFDFFPQLPQILRSCGFQNASLYFQWTWHTPEVPREDVPVVWWEGCDGSRLKTATRNRLNLHQWPEDVQILMDELAETGGEADSLILQWLELMPSPDWMCRSEVLLPKTKELLGDERFQVSFATLGEYLDTYEPVPPTRRYTMDAVWHGMTLGKNGDQIRRTSQKVESDILAAEATASIYGRFGRPYPRWDVYPAWELEEAWRNILRAQHHDHDECEGLCGDIGMADYRSAERLARGARRITRNALAQRVTKQAGDRLTLNPLGWEAQTTRGAPVPPFGYLAQAETHGEVIREVRDDHVSVREGDLELTAEIQSPHALRLRNGEHAIDRPVIGFAIGDKNLDWHLHVQKPERPKELEDGAIWAHRGMRGIQLDALLDQGSYALCLFTSSGRRDALHMRFEAGIKGLEPGLNKSLRVRFAIPDGFTQLLADNPFEVAEVHAQNRSQRKYPEGDWMTSPQWFETVENTFTASSLVDIVDPQTGRGLLIVHDGHQQWLRREGELQCVVLTDDPWDGDRRGDHVHSSFYLVPHGPMTHAQRWKTAQELRRGTDTIIDRKECNGDLPSSFSFASNTPDNVIMTALYRETRDRGYGTDNYAANDFEADYPYIIRLVEFDGIESQVELKINGTIAAAAKTNLLGQHELTLEPELGAGEFGPQSILRFTMRPKEIATVYFDLVEGRKQTRDLDAKREIWATVHRTETKS